MGQDSSQRQLAPRPPRWLEDRGQTASHWGSSARTAMAAPVSGHAGHAVQRCTVFRGERVIASGSVAQVTRMLATFAPPHAELQAFDDQTGGPIPLTGSTARTGRPRLGVQERSVMLLPRHWEWLAAQPGGASAAIRALVERAWLEWVETAGAHHAAACLARFAEAFSPPLPRLAEITAALEADQPELAEALLEDWPEDARVYARILMGERTLPER